MRDLMQQNLVKEWRREVIPQIHCPTPRIGNREPRGFGPVYEGRATRWYAGNPPYIPVYGKRAHGYICSVI